VPVSEFISETVDPADIPADVLEIVTSLKKLPPPYRQAVKDLVESLVKTTLHVA
jgi:hypothetical protein